MGLICGAKETGTGRNERKGDFRKEININRSVATFKENFSCYRSLAYLS